MSKRRGFVSTNERPWLKEPDRLEFTYKGFPCIIQRVHMKNPDNPKDILGHLCGYVAVPPGHPYHGKTAWWENGENETESLDLYVHGGITYTGKCQGVICHVPKEGESDDVWWFGFDAAHAGDLIPGMYEHRQPGGFLYDPDRAERMKQFEGHPLFNETYKTVGYMKNQIRNLVKQLIAAA